MSEIVVLGKKFPKEHQMILSYIASQLPGAAFGFVFAAFTPAIGRFLKKLFVKESTALKASANAEEQKIAKKL